METKMVDFNSTPVRYYTFGPESRDLLLDTEDICKILGITERQAGTDLSQKDMDLASAGVYAMNSNNLEFSNGFKNNS